MQTTLTTTTNKTQTMVQIGLITAITCILAPFSIPIPFSPVPISLTVLVLYISAYILGSKRGTLSYFIYLLLGAIGLPIFSGFEGGFGKMLGPTGGYLIGFLFLISVAGFIIERYPDNKVFHIFGMVVGTAICYTFGTIWLSYQLDLNFMQGLSIGVLPYLIGDGIKMAVAVIFGPVLRKRLAQFKV